MQSNDFGPELIRVFSACGLSDMLDETACGRLYELARYLVAENEKYNLTAVTDTDGIILRHFADSAALAPMLPTGVSLLDVGCGAGFPSLVLAILRPDLRITALDATEKRVRYVAAAAELLGLKNLTAVCMRAEDGAKAGAPMRESFDIVTARAVARLQILAELCIPYVRLGGRFLAMKGDAADLELKECGKGISLLGGRVAAMHESTLSNGKGESITRTIAEIVKESATPATYPRHFSRISKKPWG